MTLTKDQGNKAEIAVISEFIKRGFSVSIPFGQNDPFDLVVKFPDGFKSVQVKHGIIKNGCVYADIRHKRGYAKKVSSTYDGEADYIAIWCEELNEVYLLSLEECNGRSFLRLRKKTPKNNSCISTIIWADHYLLDKQLSLMK